MPARLRQRAAQSCPRSAGGCSKPNQPKTHRKGKKNPPSPQASNSFNPLQLFESFAVSTHTAHLPFISKILFLLNIPQMFCDSTLHPVSAPHLLYIWGYLAPDVPFLAPILQHILTSSFDVVSWSPFLPKDISTQSSNFSEVLATLHLFLRSRRVLPLQNACSFTSANCSARRAERHSNHPHQKHDFHFSFQHLTKSYLVFCVLC